MADDQAAASEAARTAVVTAPAVPSDLLGVAPDALDLFVRVAEVIHGPTAEDDKLAFVVDTTLAATRAKEGAFVRLEPKTLDVVHVAGDLDVDRLDEPTRVELVRRTLRAGDGACPMP